MDGAKLIAHLTSQLKLIVYRFMSSCESCCTGCINCDYKLDCLCVAYRSITEMSSWAASPQIEKEQLTLHVNKLIKDMAIDEHIVEKHSKMIADVKPIIKTLQLLIAQLETLISSGRSSLNPDVVVFNPNGHFFNPNGHPNPALAVSGETVMKFIPTGEKPFAVECQRDPLIL